MPLQVVLVRRVPGWQRFAVPHIRRCRPQHTGWCTVSMPMPRRWWRRCIRTRGRSHKGASLPQWHLAVLQRVCNLLSQIAHIPAVLSNVEQCLPRGVALCNVMRANRRCRLNHRERGLVPRALHHSAFNVRGKAEQLQKVANVFWPQLAVQCLSVSPLEHHPLHCGIARVHDAVFGLSQLEPMRHVLEQLEETTRIIVSTENGGGALYKLLIRRPNIKRGIGDRLQIGYSQHCSGWVRKDAPYLCRRRPWVKDVRVAARLCKGRRC